MKLCCSSMQEQFFTSYAALSFHYARVHFVFALHAASSSHCGRSYPPYCMKLRCRVMWVSISRVPYRSFMQLFIIGFYAANVAMSFSHAWLRLSHHMRNMQLRRLVAQFLVCCTACHLKSSHHLPNASTSSRHTRNYLRNRMTLRPQIMKVSNPPHDQSVVSLCKTSPFALHTAPLLRYARSRCGKFSPKPNALLLNCSIVTILSCRHYRSLYELKILQSFNCENSPLLWMPFRSELFWNSNIFASCAKQSFSFNIDGQTD